MTCRSKNSLSFAYHFHARSLSICSIPFDCLELFILHRLREVYLYGRCRHLMLTGEVSHHSLYHCEWCRRCRERITEKESLRKNHWERITEKESLKKAKCDDQAIRRPTSDRPTAIKTTQRNHYVIVDGLNYQQWIELNRDISSKWKILLRV